MATQRAMYRTSSLAVMVLALAACAGPAANPTTAPTTRPAATSAATPGTATAAATTKPGGGEAVVDLTFSGDRALVAKGSAGCRLGKRADGTVVVFGFLASESDYPGLGDSFSLIEDLASHKVSVKWLVAGTTYAGEFSSGVTVSPDHHSITLGADFPAGIDRHEHLSGSITCP